MRMKYPWARRVELLGRIDTELDEPLGFKRRGVMALTNSETELSDFESWIEVAKHYDGYSHAHACATLRSRESAGRALKGALFTPSDGRAEPFLAVPLSRDSVERRFD